MDFAGKIRAARAFLQWSQDELAQAAGVSLAGLQRVERNESQPTSRTQANITAVLEKQGIILTSKGIEYDDSPVILIHGDTPEDCYLQILDDVLATLKGKKHAELLISNADDRVSPPAVNDRYRTIRSAGIKMRQLVEAGDTYLMGALEEYRYIPSKYFINRVTVIYGDRVAIVTADEHKGSINKDAVDAETRRNVFNLMWDTLPQATESTADEKF